MSLSEAHASAAPVLERETEPHRVLHVGCGWAELPDYLRQHTETRLDINPDCKPDIVASMLDLGDIGPFEAIYSSHCLEHLYPHEVETALREFLRVLAPAGAAIILVPDLEDVRPSDDVLMVTPAGPVAGLDLMYGFRPALKTMPHMAHHTGFVASTLHAAMERAGFERIETKRLLDYNLFAVGVRP